MAIHSNNGAYLGFWKDKEYYYRFGEVLTFKIGTFLISLTDANVDVFEHQFLRLKERMQTIGIENTHTSIINSGNTLDYLFNMNSSVFSYAQDNDIGALYELISDFEGTFNQVYDYLSSLNIVLSDCLLNHICFSIDRFIQVFRISSHNSFDSKNTQINRIQQIIKENEATKVIGLDIDEFKHFLSCAARNCHVFEGQLIFEILQKCLEFITTIKTAQDGLLQIIPVTLMRDNSNTPSILKYKNLLDEYNLQCINSSIPLADSKRSIFTALNKLKFGHNRLISAVSKIISADSEDEYDELQGYRLITASNTRDLLSVACSEFEFLCANNIDIAKCKNCGRYFLPLTAASNFCDRPLVGNSNRNCKSLSSQWYADNRRSHDPVWNEYMLYRSRYNSRTYRNKAKNPKDRLDHWNKQARQLFQDYDSGKITREEFSSTLAEMDKDMKPLDEM